MVKILPGFNRKSDSITRTVNIMMILCPSESYLEEHYRLELTKYHNGNPSISGHSSDNWNTSCARTSNK